MIRFCLSTFCLGVILAGSTSFAQTTEPTPRNQPVMVYMDHLGVAVLFGGQSDGKLLNDTWIWNGGWQQLSLSRSPEARSGHAMAYDSRLNLLFLFGGKGINGLLDDTWAFDGRNWRRLNVKGPTARRLHSVTYDANKGKMILFGGEGADLNSLADTWVYNGIRWSEQSSPIPARQQHAMAYDPIKKSMVLFGGFSMTNGARSVLADTWELRGRRWAKVRAEGPKARGGHSMAYDPSTKAIIMFGGYNKKELGDTWQYIKGAWRMFGSNGPARAGKPAMFYDYLSELLILYGGQGRDGLLLSDFWRFEGRWVKD